MAEDAATNPVPSSTRCPALIIMVGTPGSGKSYLGRTLSVALGAELLQTDAVRKEMFPEPRYTPHEASAVYAVCHEHIAAALARGACVIFDGTNLHERHRRILYDLAGRANATVSIVVAYASGETIRERLRLRGQGIDPLDQSDADFTVYQRMRRDQEPISRPHLIVNTEARPEPVIRLLRRQLER